MGFNLIAERRRDAGVMPCIFFYFLFGSVKTYSYICLIKLKTKL